MTRKLANEKKTWRYRVGFFLFFICYPLFYLPPLVVPYLGFSAAYSMTIISVSMAVVCGVWLLSIPLLGREGFSELKSRILHLWKGLMNQGGK